MTASPKVYSYIRFSSKEQADGTSAKRQLKFAERWAQEHDMVLDITLILSDEGKSGYHGDHITAGALGQFLELVRMNRIVKGSVLVVETEDRLGRLPIEVSLPIFFQIINADITLVFAQDSSRYDKQQVRENQMILLKPIMKMILAYEESLQKSKRIKEARNIYREAYRTKGRRLTKMSPFWLTLNEARDGWEVNTHMVDTIQRIYQWYVDGKSASEIVRILNSDPAYPKVPMNVKSKPFINWSLGNVRSVLGDPRLIGHFQFHEIIKKDPDNPLSKMIRVPIGEVLKGYYKVVIDEALWQKVRDIKDANATKPGRGGGNHSQNRNLFVHMVRCHKCGGRLHYIQRTGKRMKLPTLECDNRRYHATDENRKRLCVNGKNFRYKDVEKVFFAGFKKLDLEALLPSKDEITVRIEGLEADLSVAGRKAKEMEAQIANLTTSLGSVQNPKARAHLGSELDKAFIEQEALQKHTEELTLRLQSSRSERETLQSQVNRSGELYELMENTPEEELPDLRKRIQNKISTYVSHIVPLPTDRTKFKQNTVAALKIYFHDGNRTTTITNWME